ncbi:ATP-binding protein [Actinocorallia longicatena]|uniref:Winged helix-turn-helix domain-containing protein n=1 Tax=Actinocorallia longicatena TaxID=111803 RepID=A0ABP6QM07_9ACTN
MTLPAEPNGFVGRERDIEELVSLADAARLVTLCGPGGIGKSRLALRIAHVLGAEETRFVELGDLPPGRDVLPLAQLLVRRLGLVREAGGEAVTALADGLRDRTLLIVLDTCEHVVEACAELALSLLADCPGLRLLATSREPLRIPGETIWRVPPLDLPGEDDPAEKIAEAEAVRLFAARAAAARPGFAVTKENAAAVVEVCRALDGMPLAIELAAARVRVLSVEQLAARLADRFAVLSSGDRTAPSRQRTLRAAIDWSYELLEEPEKLLLSRLSVFCGWTVEQAEGVCADEVLPAADVLDRLTALVDKSLVGVVGERAGEVHFRLLDSIREYAAERLAGRDETAVLRDRHRDWYVRLAREGVLSAFGWRRVPWGEQIRRLRMAVGEHENLRAALDWSWERGDVEAGLRLLPAVHVMSMSSGHLADWLPWTDRFLARADEAPPDAAAVAIVTRVRLAQEFHDFGPDTGTLTERGVELSRACGDDRLLAFALFNRSVHHLTAVRFEEAEADLDESEALARASGDAWNEAVACYGRAMLQLMRGRSREPVELCERGVALMAGAGLRWGVARGRVLLGTLARERGDQAEAHRQFTEALGPLRDLGARPEIVRCLAGSGHAAVGLGDLPGARRSLTEALVLGRELGMHRVVARSLEALANLHAAEDDPRTAVVLAAAATALREAVGKDLSSRARLESLLERVRAQHGAPYVALCGARAGRSRWKR